MWRYVEELKAGVVDIGPIIKARFQPRFVEIADGSVEDKLQSFSIVTDGAE